MVVLTPEDQACSLAQSLIGFDKRIPFYTDGNLACGMFTETTEAGKNSEEVLGKFPEGEYQYLVIGPLDKFANLAPDFIWVYGMPGQITASFRLRFTKMGAVSPLPSPGEAVVSVPLPGQSINRPAKWSSMAMVNGYSLMRRI